MPISRRTGILSAFLLAVYCLQGCFSPVKYATPLDEVVVENTYGDLALTGEIRDRWWESFGDSELNKFVEIVLENSPTLQSAYLKLLDSEYAVTQSKAGYYPSASFNAGVGAGGNVYNEASADPNYSLGLSASYEIDIWGKVRAQKRVAELSMYAAQDAAESAAISLVGNVVTEWFAIKYYRDRQKLTQELLEIAEGYYELVEEYYRNGQTTGMDVLEQRQQIETLRATLNELDTNIRISQHKLKILAGGKANPVVEGSLPEDIDVGGSIDVDSLLENRPDIRSARRSAEQADARIVIAIADRLPTLRLSASLSYRSKTITELFERLVWDVGASLAVNLFDGFNKTTAIDRAKVTYLQQRLAYGVTVMQAIAEVEEALLNLNLRKQTLIDARAQLERQRDILEVSREYFTGGQVTYNRVLSALRSLISASQSELDARRQLLNAQITFYKAMGGSGWLKDTSEQNTKRVKEMLEQLDED